MVTILEFQRPDETGQAGGAESKSRNLPKGHSAEIIIFPGVRIERRSESDAAEDVAKQPARSVRGSSRRKQ